MSTVATPVTTPQPALVLHDSFIELPARERARALLDAGTFRELLGPFDRIESPWLPLQGIVCQADDGCVIARGTIDGEPAVVAAIESAFQGGSIGEVSGSKIAAALELALARLRTRQAGSSGGAVRNRRRASAGSQSGPRRDRRDPGGDRRAAPACAGGRRDLGDGGLLRRHVARRRAVLVSGRHQTRPARHERARSDRTGSRYRRTRFQRPPPCVATDRWRTAGPDGLRGCPRRRRSGCAAQQPCSALLPKASRRRIGPSRSTPISTDSRRWIRRTSHLKPCGPCFIATAANLVLQGASMNEPSLTRGARWFRALAGETATRRARVERRRSAWQRNRALLCGRPRSAEPLSARDR